MYNLVLLLAAAALLCEGDASNVNRRLKLLAEMDNNIQNSALPTHVPPSKKLLSLMRKPPAITVYEAESTVEITCEAFSAPAPSIHWYRNDAPVYEHDQESNEVIDTNPTSLARITSTLLVPRLPGATKYTCAVVAGSRTNRASSVVVTSSVTEPTERSKLVPLAPRILVSYKVLVDIIGNNIVLPCRSRGHPRPHTVWFDNNRTRIDNQSRMKVLRSGELVISAVRWSDMGEYACRSTNMFGSATALTFLYPAKASKTKG